MRSRQPRWTRSRAGRSQTAQGVASVASSITAVLLGAGRFGLGAVCLFAVLLQRPATVGRGAFGDGRAGVVGGLLLGTHAWDLAAGAVRAVRAERVVLEVAVDNGSTAAAAAAFAVGRHFAARPVGALQA